jgi:quercetin dioxygenase-like cupin family protein
VQRPTPRLRQMPLWPVVVSSRICWSHSNGDEPEANVKIVLAHAETWRKTMSAKAVIRMPGEGKHVNTLAGRPLSFLVTGEDTRHTSMFDCTVPPGSSVGLHVHRVHEETFYMLEGECEWQVGSQLVRARPGTFAFIPPGVPHNLANASDKPARMLLTISPPGQERYFEELEKLVTHGGPPDANAIAELMSRYDTEQLSAPKAI